ncbi:hypothetical protein GFS31_27410 [Leptolyngbya sp. BL0902]|nr:hypothetical protein GFS31_27410 [Leptolyngbya sp. BL0902]
MNSGLLGCREQAVQSVSVASFHALNVSHALEKERVCQRFTIA